MAVNAYDTFRVTHFRGRKIVESAGDLYTRLDPQQRPPTVETFNQQPFLTDIARSGVVVAVAAFDRYFTTRFAECVTPILTKEGPSPALLAVLDKAGLDLKGALDLLHMERPHRRIRSLVSDHLSEYVTQKFSVIDELFDGIGLKGISKHAEARAKRTTLRKSIEKLIRRRHIIVHAGDVDGRGKLYPVNHSDFIKRIDHLKILVDNAEAIVTKRMATCMAKPAKKTAKRVMKRKRFAKKVAKK